MTNRRAFAPKFTVDTHLFRELGELLVGRDSTALIELIKNAYDADATNVTVFASALDRPEDGVIRIADDGLGMSPDQFEIGFLRIASRSKELGDRRSVKYGRRYTGAKGIGRLAAHKLAAEIQVSSDPAPPETTGVDARIRWDHIESFETLDDVDDEAISVTPRVRKGQEHGTVISLRRLRRKWSGADRGRFLAEVQTFSPAPILVEPLPVSVLDTALLFERPVINDASGADPGFNVSLEGDLAGGDEYWRTLAEACAWVIEVDASPDGIQIAVAPTIRTLRSRPSADKTVQRQAHPQPDGGPFFQARILIREGRLPVPAQVGQWASRLAGIRVYLEGFRVLPYGERSNDWLSLDADYARRTRTFPFEDADQTSDADDDAALQILPNTGYFGAVFLTEERAASLRMLVNREGFIPDPSYYVLEEILRRAISLSVRVRAAAPRKNAGVDSPAAEPSASSAVALKQTLDEAIHEVSGASASIRGSSFELAATQVNRASQLLVRATDQAQALISEAAMLRVLASVGTQMAAFVHEVYGLVAAAEAVESGLEELAGAPGVDARYERRLGDMRNTTTALRDGLNRQASYLTDVLTPDARRRRSKQSLRNAVEAAVRLAEPSIRARETKIEISIEGSLRTPAMYRAELIALLVNLLTNAIKASSDLGAIRISAVDQEGQLVLRMENSGVRVRPKEGERWFKPFESSTEIVDPILGQGMGMGLPITRRILADYGGDIRFIQPSAGYSTAVEVRWPR